MAPSGLRSTLEELVGVMRNDAVRGVAPPVLLAARYAAVGEAAKAREPFAYREALLELAACATALAARLQAPAIPVPRITHHREDPLPTALKPTRASGQSRKRAAASSTPAGRLSLVLVPFL
jgi:hypothetical protein